MNYKHEIKLQFKKQTLLAVILGVLIATSSLITYFYLVLTPNYTQNLADATNEKQRTINKLTSEINIMKTSQNCKTNCAEPIYDRENVKEFYIIKTNKNDWLPLASNQLGISFEYPVDAQKQVQFEFNSWPDRDFNSTGTEYTWSIKDMGKYEPQETIAWGASKDLLLDRESIDIYKWTEEAGKYYIHARNNQKYEVQRIDSFDTKFGTQALLYQSPCFFFCEIPDAVEAQKKKVLIVNLPNYETSGIESISILVKDHFTNIDIDRLLSSFKLL